MVARWCAALMGDWGEGGEIGVGEIYGFLLWGKGLNMVATMVMGGGGRC